MRFDAGLAVAESLGAGATSFGQLRADTPAPVAGGLATHRHGGTMLRSRECIFETLLGARLYADVLSWDVVGIPPEALERSKSEFQPACEWIAKMP